MEAPFELGLDDLLGGAGLALRQRFAEADDGGKLVGKGGQDFLVDAGVRFAEELATFAVAENDVLASDIFEHFPADFAGEGSFLRGVHVLSAEGDEASFDSISDFAEVDMGRADGDLNGGVEDELVQQLLGQLQARLAKEVHFPVASDQDLAL